FLARHLRTGEDATRRDREVARQYPRRAAGAEGAVREERRRGLGHARWPGCVRRGPPCKLDETDPPSRHQAGLESRSTCLGRSRCTSFEVDMAFPGIFTLHRVSMALPWLASPGEIMKRRQFILLLSGGALAGLTSARAQQSAPPRRISVVMLYPDNDPQGQLRAEAFRDQLEKSGWKIGGNLQINFQWGTGDVDWVRAATARALQSSPELLLANGDAAYAAQQLVKTIPVVFIGSADPVGDGLVQSF